MGEVSLKDLLGDLAKASGLDANKFQTFYYKSLVLAVESFPSCRSRAAGDCGRQRTSPVLHCYMGRLDVAG